MEYSLVDNYDYFKVESIRNRVREENRRTKLKGDRKKMQDNQNI